MTPADNQQHDPNHHHDDLENGGPAERRTPRSPRGWMRAIAWRKRQLAWEHYRSLDTTARAGISDEDYATTMATLEAMARNLGWSEDAEAERHEAHHGRSWKHRGHGWKGRGHGMHHGHRMHPGHHGRCGEHRAAPTTGAATTAAATEATTA